MSAQKKVCDNARRMEQDEEARTSTYQAYENEMRVILSALVVEPSIQVW